MDSTTLAAPALSSLDALTQSVGAGLYLLVGVTAWLRAPRDVRTRVFLGLALASAAAFAPSGVAYARGIRDASTLPRSFTAVITAGLGVGALALFHLAQVFPRRRSWIRESGIQMPVGYLLTPCVISGLVWCFPANLASITRGYVIGFIVFGFPLLVLLGLVLPVAAIVSLARSYRECSMAERPELLRARAPVAAILFSQVAGGALAIVFAPVLAVVAPNSVAQTVLILIIWSIGLLTPVAFAAAVWRLGVLSIDPSV